MRKSKGQIKPNGHRDAMLEALQNMKEYDLTTKVLIPLIKTWGYDSIDYHGGPYEEGKDLICWGLDEIADVRLGVVQVKRYEPSSRASDIHSFGEIVTQLCQATEMDVPHTNGQYYKPSCIYFITPYPIPTRSLKTRFEKLVALRTSNVKIIDGAKLVSLLMTNLPSIARALCGIDAEVANAVSSQLTNDVLMGAIQSHARNIKAIYTDVDFLLGRPTTRLLVLSELKPNVKDRDISPEDWPELRDAGERLLAEYGLALFSRSADEIDSDYTQRAARYKAQVSELAQLLADINRIVVTISDSVRMLRSLAETIRRQDHEAFSGMGPLLAAIDVWYRLIKDNDASVRVPRGLAKLEQQAAEGIRKAKGSPDTMLDSWLSRTAVVVDALTRLTTLQQKRFRLEGLNAPMLSVVIKGDKLAAFVNDCRTSLKQSIRRYNKKKPTTGQLKTFLIECQRIFASLGPLLSNKHVVAALGIDACVRFRIGSDEFRLEIPVQDIFATGQNTLLLGEAGAGKTTSLQVYAYNILSNGSDSKLAVYAPLSRICRAVLGSESDVADEAIGKLESGIASYLKGLGVSIQPNEALRILNERQGVLLLDGIDEAIKTAPWIVTGIAGLGARYPNIQVVTSSRTAGEYLDKLAFLGITLLPFTDGQRNAFVRRWFAGQKESPVTHIISHLKRHKEMAAIVRNPLLATILCVLAEKKIPLPKREIALYEERMRLLLHQYDVHKGISRIRSQWDHLEKLSQRLAFAFHSAGKREETRETIGRLARGAMKNDLDDIGIETALEELIHPCNVLVPMTEDGRYGFDHLRYQEFLVAQELVRNRSIRIGPLVANSWWRGVLGLFAQMCEDISWLIEELAIDGTMQQQRETIMMIVKERPADEREALLEVVNRNASLDDRYGFLAGNLADEDDINGEIEDE